MKKHQQRQILELLDTIKEAQSAGLYADCQDCAIAVGEFIEGITGEGTETVRLLEEYCELLYKASTGEIGDNPLMKHLTTIVNSVKAELKHNQIEIAFISYKASMSDCLESIYLEAKKDPECDAYWIPVPYYDRNPGGTFGTVHFEGQEYYRDEIECTNWRDYDIEARRPDVIFTFNPYDANNYLTSVHPDFYCERLRGFTDLLVYVPYFVALWSEIGDHYIKSPGCLYAHRVILQSDNIRNAYLRVHKESYGNNFGKPEDKFVVLGSPKLDKVINARREDFVLPNDWLELIRNKKVVLLITSVNAMLNGSEQYLKKLSNVLNIFNNRSDITLWWRPHPLSEVTFQTLRPGLLKEYAQIVKDFRLNGQGIYDESSDLHRAIAWTDAYYGDLSSVAALFEVTGKPIMIGNTELSPETLSEFPLVFDYLYEDELHYWFTGFDYNALFKMDKTTWKAEYIGSFPDIRSSGGRCFSSVVKCNDKLYFAPSGSNNIGVFDLSTGQFDSIRFEGSSSPFNHKFSYACTFGANVFFFGTSSPEIIKLDTNNGSFSYYSDHILPLKKLQCNSDGVYLGIGFAIERQVFLPAQSANALVVFDMENCTTDIISIPSQHRGYSSICFDGESFWLAPRRSGGTIVKWNKTDGVTELKVPNDWADGSFWTVCFASGRVWYFPTTSGTAFVVNPATNEIELSEAFSEECLLRTKETTAPSIVTFYIPQVLKDSILVHKGLSNTLVQYYPLTAKTREERIVLSPEYRRSLNDFFLSTYKNDSYKTSWVGRAFAENACFSVSDYLDAMHSFPEAVSNETGFKQIAEQKKDTIHKDGMSGLAILNEIKRLSL